MFGNMKGNKMTKQNTLGRGFDPSDPSTQNTTIESDIFVAKKLKDSKKQLLNLKSFLKEGLIDQQRRNMLDNERYLEDLEDFTSISKGKKFHLKMSEMRPHQRYPHGDSGERELLENRTLIGNDTLFKEGKDLI